MLRVSAAALLFRTHAEQHVARRALPKLPELIAVQIKLLPARLSGAVPARGVIDSKRPPPTNRHSAHRVYLQRFVLTPARACALECTHDVIASCPACRRAIVQQLSLRPASIRAACMCVCVCGTVHCA